jgi:hypothetical protein
LTCFVRYCWLAHSYSVIRVRVFDQNIIFNFSEAAYSGKGLHHKFIFVFWRNFFRPKIMFFIFLFLHSFQCNSHTTKITQSS